MEITDIGSEKNIKKEDLGGLAGSALQLGHSLAIYSMPGQEKINFLAGEAAELPLSQINEKGFLVAPFSFNGNGFFIFPSDDAGKNDFNGGAINWHSGEAEDFEEDKDGFKKRVRFALEQLRGGAFKKVVIARKQNLNSPGGFSPLELFFRLKSEYPHAFVSLVSTPKFGTWIGATPELLLKVENKKLQTVALAGTIEKDEEFSGKDREEQEIVSSYIKECFNKFSLPVEYSGAQKINAGNIFHLQSVFEAKLNGKDIFWRTFLETLHPTPAVSGYPKKITGIFLRNEENFDRKLYSGFLGPVMGPDDVSLFVNLRCMEYSGPEITLYAGVGIVGESNPEKEWSETELKMDTIKKLIFS